MVLIARKAREYKEKSPARRLGFSFGSGGRDRTYDQLINSQLLYR
jgi:hypothetical protein